ncbi:MAG: ATPase domain-containing protein [Desulfurococcaceae archaeon]
MSTSFITGISGLDELLGDIPSKSMLLIVGHPGSGKTTLASKICYSNALRGHKCLFITFYEDKEKLYRNMGKLGINLQEAESKQLLTYVKLPVASPEEIMNTISNLVVKSSYSIVVIDSVNPILELIEALETKKAVLLNFFYHLDKIVNGLLVVVAEIQMNKEVQDLGGAEFVSDIVLALRLKKHEGLISRSLEIRKARGSPILLAEIPFTIMQSRGIDLHVPPTPVRPLVTLSKELRGLELWKHLIGSIYSGDVITNSAPPYARNVDIFIPIIALALFNDLKIMVFSFKWSPHEFKMMIPYRVLAEYTSLKREEIRWVVQNYFFFESINPSRYPLEELISHIRGAIEKYNPGIIVINKAENIWIRTKDKTKYWNNISALYVWLKNNGKLVIHLTTRISEGRLEQMRYYQMSL